MNEVIMFKRLFLLCLLVSLQLGCSQNPVQPIPIVAAGVPKTLAEAENFAGIFHTLAEAGMTVFFPTFQFQEVPEVKSLGFETYFLPPCQPLNPALSAMLQEKVSLMVPGELLYPQLPAPLPAQEEDPLRALLACLSDKGVYGVYSYDEPVTQGVSLGSVRRFYERVKSIDPNLPVMMIHAPMLADAETLQTSEQRAAYLDNVKTYSQYADVVGFDVYPIPQHIAQVITPYSSDITQDYRLQLADYLQWLQAELPAKRHALVLQGFSYTYQFADGYLEENFPPEVLATIRPPSREELNEMVKVVQGHNAQVIWWGQSFIEEDEMALWNDILLVTKQAGR
jgi:hypothetical protein